MRICLPYMNFIGILLAFSHIVYIINSATWLNKMKHEWIMLTFLFAKSHLATVMFPGTVKVRQFPVKTFCNCLPRHFHKLRCLLSSHEVTFASSSMHRPDLSNSILNSGREKNRSKGRHVLKTSVLTQCKPFESICYWISYLLKVVNFCSINGTWYKRFVS